MIGLTKSPDQYIERATEASEKEEWLEAAKNWQKLIRRFPDNYPPSAWLNLTQAYVHLKNFDKAEQSAKQGLKKHPKLTKLLILSAKIANTNEDWQVAKERWGNIIDKLGDEAPPIAWASLAKVERLAGKLEQAGHIAEDGLAKHGKNLQILVELAEVQTAKKDWATALSYWQDVLTTLNDQDQPSVTISQRARFNISIIKRLTDIKGYKTQIKKYSESKKVRRIAIVTSFTKGYDVLKPPEVLDDRFDYLVYTDDKLSGLGIFDIKPLPTPELDGGRAIRYVKTHPHTLLGDYDVVVWVDTSLMIVGDIYPIIKKFMDSNLAIGSGVHPLRKNIYEEFEANVKLKKEKYKILKKQINFYKRKNFEHNDLAENTLLMFNLKNNKLAPTLETWWQQILRFSKRDQLSFNYSLAQNGTDWFKLTKPPQDIRNHPSFVITAHYIDLPVLAELTKALKTIN